MKKLKIYGLIIAATIMCSSMALPVSAANNADTSFKFSVGYEYTHGKDTERRSKTNTSSMYIQSTTAYKLYVQCLGAKTLGAASDDYTAGGYAIIPVTCKRRVRQYIYENGSRWAYFHITTADYKGNITATGLWSPDSVGSDPYAN